LFSSGLLTNFTSEPSSTGGRAGFVNLGTQLNFRLVLFTYLNATLSGGYAAADHGRSHLDRIHGIAKDPVIFSGSSRLILEQAGVSVLPVLLFLLGLAWIDTYKLLTLRRVLRSVGVGCVVAAACYGINTGVYAAGVVSPAVWSRSGAPVIEEVAKALYVAWLLRTSRVGFMVDTAISGFAVGAGFALVENPDLHTRPFSHCSGGKRHPRPGTAMMHGGTTAIFGTVSVNWSEIRGSRSPLLLLPGS